MAFGIRYQEVKEISRPTESGMTQPYFCRLEDGELYIVKGQGATYKGLIAEAVAASLGRAMGLPIPDIAIAEVDSSLLALNPAARSSIGAGATFASKYEPNLIDALPLIGQLPKDVLRNLFVFDYWIQNEDRTGTIYGGNSNLFLQAGTSRVVVIDHNLAFQSDFDFAKNRSMHICKDIWREHAGDLVLRDYLTREMEIALEAIDGYEDALPLEWRDGAPGFTNEINGLLSRYRSNVFWDELKR